MPTAVEGYRYGRIAVRGFGVEVQAVAVGRAVYFPLRPLVESIGLASQMQIKKLREDSRFSAAFRLLPVPTIKGLRDTWCINKRAVSMWLAELDPARCSLRARPAVERFQAELFAAADRFLFGEQGATVYDPVTRQSTPLVGDIQSVGDCPHCGGRLCVTMDVESRQMHITPAPEDEDEGD